MCRYAGNIHTQVTEVLLQEIFASTGPVESCKLIRKDKVGGVTLLSIFSKTYYLELTSKCCFFFTLCQSSYGFVHYFDRRSAGLAIMSLNGRHL